MKPRRNVERFRGGLVCKAHRLLHHSTPGLRVIKKKRRLKPRPASGAMRLCPSVYVSVPLCLCLCPSLFLSLPLSVSGAVPRCLCPSLCPSLALSLSLSVSVPLCLSRSVSVATSSGQRSEETPLKRALLQGYLAHIQTLGFGGLKPRPASGARRRRWPPSSPCSSSSRTPPPTRYKSKSDFGFRV